MIGRRTCAQSIASSFILSLITRTVRYPLFPLLSLCHTYRLGSPFSNTRNFICDIGISMVSRLAPPSHARNDECHQR